MGAAGTGYFQIYKGGAEEAMKGSPEFAGEWGGNPAWNTRWKAILGGALRATSKYVGDYQNTFYLQKFNVDPRSSRNFWGQYMQSIFGSYGRASSMYKSYSEGGVLDMPYRFLIPVFSGMPEKVCAYPDGTELADPKPINSTNVESYEFLDLNKIQSRYAKSSFPSEKISWRCLVAQNGNAIPLGKIDLSKYSSVVIEFSVAEKFDSFAGNKKALLGLVSDPSCAADDTGNAAFIAGGRLADGVAGGFLYRRNVTVDLSKVARSGEVYLTGFLAEGQKYIIHNIVFITKKGYEAPEAESYVPADTAEIESSGEDETAEAPETADEVTSAAPKSGCGAAAGGCALAAAAAVCAVVKKKKEGER